MIPKLKDLLKKLWGTNEKDKKYKITPLPKLPPVPTVVPPITNEPTVPYKIENNYLKDLWAKYHLVK